MAMKPKKMRGGGMAKKMRAAAWLRRCVAAAWLRRCAAAAWLRNFVAVEPFVNLKSRLKWRYLEQRTLN